MEQSVENMSKDMFNKPKKPKGEITLYNKGDLSAQTKNSKFAPVKKKSFDKIIKPTMARIKKNKLEEDSD